jgi:hypothetical protein
VRRCISVEVEAVESAQQMAEELDMLEPERTG